MYYKCNENMHRVCSNSALCHLCDGIRLFKDPVAEAKAKREAAEQRKKDKKEALLKTKDGPKEGMLFERKVQKTWNTTVTGRKATQKPVSKPRLEVDTGEAKRLGDASGSLWFAKGDIKLQHALMECKERGTVNARGEKQITIPKEWLDKMELEAFKEARDFWYLPFGFKGSDEIYLVKPYDHEMQIINDLRVAREHIENLQIKLKELGYSAPIE